MTYYQACSAEWEEAAAGSHKPIHGLVTDGAGAPFTGVAVTNGRDVMTTDDGGAFSLEPAGQFIALTRPTGRTTDRWFVRIDAGAAEDSATQTSEMNSLTRTGSRLHSTGPRKPGR